jgi:predicted DsbA family dithiol-disulfide isomerase
MLGGNPGLIVDGSPRLVTGWVVTEVNSMQIEVFSDVVCPFCYIGKRRLEQALTEFDHRDEVTVTYRSFELDPSSPLTSDLSLDQMLAQKYGQSLEQARSMNSRVSDMAATAGLDFQLQDAHPANTFRAHRLLHFAATNGLGNELTERLMRGYFTEGVRIGDREALLTLAVEVGLAEDAAAAVLDGDAYTAEVRADIELARAFGATGVPFFVFDRKYAISGAQETALFEDVLGKAWSDAQPLTVVGGGGVCEDDVCAVPES